MESDWLAEIRKLASDNKILAIKRYREHTHVGLKEAMEAVQALLDAPQPPPATPPTVPKDIIRLLSMGRKIEAIKMYREMAGGGLKEAKEAVEALQAGHTVRMPARPAHHDVNQELMQLLLNGKTIDAIKLYRTHNAVSLKEAKDAVEALEKQIKQTK